MEPNSPKKIQFAVPPFQSQIDPEAAEQVRKTSFTIRKRRPTPASLVIMNEHVPPEPCRPRGRWGRMGIAPLPSHRVFPPQAQSASPKQRKQSVYTPPAIKGIKHLKSQNDSAFPEEDEGVSEREEDWGH
ncbi:PPR1C phosphatase, partial [Nothocercus nigrocapillus]|nr:PPR1C phosphatase [Nothocercus nigrocapillus]